MAVWRRHLALCFISGESPSLSESLKSTFSLRNRRQRVGMVEGGGEKAGGINLVVETETGNAADWTFCPHVLSGPVFLS